MKLNLKMWKDILTEKIGTGEKLYSQGRVYLLFSIIAYYITLGIITWKALKPTIDIAESTLNTIITALQWTIALFASYTLGGKVIEGVKTVLNKTSTTQDVTAIPQTDNTDKQI